jgi:hypothetical protein
MKVSQIISAAGLSGIKNEEDLLRQLRQMRKIVDAADKAGGGDRANQWARSGTILDLVNERMDRDHLSYADAWAAVVTENPALLEGMRQPPRIEPVKRKVS